MEQVVSERLGALIHNFECCKCEKCLEDMEAIALNAIPPKYVNSEKGELYGKVGMMNIQNHHLVDLEIIRAIDFVSKKPRHEIAVQATSSNAETFVK
jgi:competence protein ComFB